MKKLIEGVRRFREKVFPENRAFYEHLAQNPQKPRALFITCSDSRVMPHDFTQSEPGELFQIRNAGNIIPPHGSEGGGERATIEYSVEVLGIRNIIICGHSQCGAMAAILAGKVLEQLPASRAWFENAEATKRIVMHKYKHLQGEALAMAATEENVLVQLNHLSTHPCVAALLAAGEMKVFGWYYDIGRGQVLQYDQSQGKFVELDGEAHAAAPLPVRDENTPPLL